MNSRPSAYRKVISRLFTHRISICATTKLCLQYTSYQWLCVSFFLRCCSFRFCSCFFSNNSRSGFPHCWSFQLCFNRLFPSGVSVRILPDFSSFRFFISFSHDIAMAIIVKSRCFTKIQLKKKRITWLRPLIISMSILPDLYSGAVRSVHLIPFTHIKCFIERLKVR